MIERMNEAIGKNNTMFIIYVNNTRVTYKKINTHASIIVIK